MATKVRKPPKRPNHKPKGLVGTPFNKDATPKDWKVGDFVFIFPKAPGYNLKLDIIEALTDAEIERSIEGASTLTLTLSDPNQALLLSGIMDTDKNGKLETVEVQVNDNWYRMVSISITGGGAGTVVLQFEDRDIAHLRTFTKYREWKRTKKFVRAMAIKAMANEAGIRTFIPELTTKQKIGAGDPVGTSVEVEGNSDSAGDSTSLKQRIRGWKNLKDGEFVGYYDRAQIWVDAGGKESDAPMASALVDGESSGIVGNSNYCCWGLWQVNALAHGSQFAGSGYGKEWLRARKAVAIRAGSPGAWGINPWEACQDAACSPYKSTAEKVRKIIARQGGLGQGSGDSGGGSRTVTTTRREPYKFRRGEKGGKRESSWDAMTRMAAEVGWRVFMAKDTLIFMAEDDPTTVNEQGSHQIEMDLLKGAIYTTIDGPTDELLLGYSGEIDVNKKESEFTFSVLADRWAFTPGMVVRLQGFSAIYNGRWLVANTRRNLFNPTSEVTLKRASKSKLEPPNETVTKTRTIEDKHNNNQSAGDSSSGGFAKPLSSLPAISPGGDWGASRPYGGHTGVDFAVPSGTPVLAATSGTVKLAAANGGYGNQIKIDHDNVWATSYAHLSSIGVRLGQKVNQGQQIGRTGNTGTSTGPHLHYMVYKRGTPINPHSVHKQF